MANCGPHCKLVHGGYLRDCSMIPFGNDGMICDNEFLCEHRESVSSTPANNVSSADLWIPQWLEPHSLEDVSGRISAAAMPMQKKKKGRKFDFLPSNSECGRGLD